MLLGRALLVVAAAAALAAPSVLAATDPVESAAAKTLAGRSVSYSYAPAYGGRGELVLGAGRSFVVHLRLPARPRLAGGSKPLLRLDATSAASAGFDPSRLRTTSPGSVLALLDGASAGTERPGRATVRKGTAATVPVEAWADAGGLLRRISATYAADTSATVDYADFGAPVDVRVPPAAQTEDLTTRKGS